MWKKSTRNNYGYPWGNPKNNPVRTPGGIPKKNVSHYSKIKGGISRDMSARTLSEISVNAEKISPEVSRQISGEIPDFFNLGET